MTVKPAASLSQAFTLDGMHASSDRRSLVLNVERPTVTVKAKPGLGCSVTARLDGFTDPSGPTSARLVLT
ncbi:hypothetical protein [Reinekea sp.]|uniref:hypothetical protein n=1 Tax=Reinekea sp. TaxID=1970455 RepID=UPI002A82B081|nr:hypothetical protein [Reinekea sp.]